jgi:predicted nucleotidyltransferase
MAAIMTALERQLRKSVDDMTSVGARFALVGGLAVSTRAEPRLTRDADLAVAVLNDQEAEHIAHDMQLLGYQVVAAVEQDATGRLSTVRLSLSGSIVTDLLFASCGIETEIVESATSLEVLPGFTMPVATTGHLIAMKLLARDDRKRPSDADDLRALREVASESDYSVARAGVALIEQRGYSRGRDLRAALELLITDGAF